MFRAGSSRTALFTTTVESRKHHHRHCAHGYAMSGQAASICNITTPTLNRSHQASWNLAGIADHDNSSAHMSAGFQARTQPSVFRGDQGYGDIDGVSAYGFGSYFSSIGTKISEIYSALASPKQDTLVLRRGGVVNVPRGQPVSEAEWASLETGRKVTFNRRIGVVLIPSKGECYPTPAHKAASFLSRHEIAQEARRIAAGGEDNPEWAALLTETRQDAQTAREHYEEAQVQKEEEEEAQQQQQQQSSSNKATETAALTFFEIVGLLFA